jgi:opacity protein-like surface antigen
MVWLMTIQRRGAMPAALSMLVLLTAGIFDGSTEDQRLSIRLFTGIGGSSFDEMVISDWGQSEYIPLGIQLVYHVSPWLSLGAEAETPLLRFSFDEYPEDEGNIIHRIRISELGAFGRLGVHLGDFEPYFRAGAAVYDGTRTEQPIWDEEGPKEYLRSNPGWNAGGGVEYRVSRCMTLGLEGVCHHYRSSVSDDIQSENYGYSFWAVRVLGGISIF